MLLPGIKDANVYVEWPTFDQIKCVSPPTVPQHVVHRWKALCENLPAGQVKIRLKQKQLVEITLLLLVIVVFHSCNGTTIRFSDEYLQFGEFTSRRSTGIK